MKKPEILVVTLCRDEEEILPFFLRHYEEIASRIIVFHNAPSIDSSADIIDAHPLCTRIDYHTDGYVRDDLLMLIKNSAWVEYRDHFDWIIVVDMDEFLYHEDIFCFLDWCKESGISIPCTEGFDMLSDEWPFIGEKLTDYAKLGVRNRLFDKPVVFDPTKIERINYRPGAHFCQAEGVVKYGDSCELKLLHYKYMGGLERLKYRWTRYGERLSEINKKWRWGMERLNPNEIEKRYQRAKSNLVRVID